MWFWALLLIGDREDRLEGGWGRGFFKKKEKRKKRHNKHSLLGVEECPRAQFLEHFGFNIPAKVSRARKSGSRMHYIATHANISIPSKQQCHPFLTQDQPPMGIVEHCLWLDKERATFHCLQSRINLPHIQTEKKQKKFYVQRGKAIHSRSLYNSGLYIIYSLNCKNRRQKYKEKPRSNYITWQ